MIIIKCTCLFLIFIISTYIGILKSKTFKTRLDELNNIQISLNLFKNKIEYSNDTIESIFNFISKIVYENKENIFINTAENLGKEDIYMAWNDSVENFNYFKPDDKQIIKLFGKNLGKLDKKGQINQIDETICLINKQIKIAEVEKDKNEKLYKSLGSIAGAIIVIILI